MSLNVPPSHGVSSGLTGVTVPYARIRIATTCLWLVTVYCQDRACSFGLESKTQPRCACRIILANINGKPRCALTPVPAARIRPPIAEPSQARRRQSVWQTHPKITAFHFIISSSHGDPLIPVGGSYQSYSIVTNDEKRESDVRTLYHTLQYTDASVCAIRGKCQASLRLARSVLARTACNFLKSRIKRLRAGVDITQRSTVVNLFLGETRTCLYMSMWCWSKRHHTANALRAARQSV